MNTLAAMPAHNEDEHIAKVVLGARGGRWQYRFNCGNRGSIRGDGCTAQSNFFSKEKTLTKRGD